MTCVHYCRYFDQRSKISLTNNGVVGLWDLPKETHPSVYCLFYVFIITLTFCLLRQAVILARTRCDVSLTALRNESPGVHSAEPSTREKRPLSAPSTREEITTAERLSSAVIDDKAPVTREMIPVYKSEPNKPRPHTSHHINMYSPRTLNTSARSGVRESLVPTPVNISNQGIQNLQSQREFLS